MPRHLTHADEDAWAGYVRHVQALPGVPPPPANPAPIPAPTPLPPPTPSPPRLRTRPAALEVGAHPGGIDTGTWTRFRTGRLRAARTLDLHGRTAQAAHAALHLFLRAAHADGARCVEVITGRGQGETGVIRRELPHWLNAPELRPLVLAAAHPHPANPGSVRVLLRRTRTPR